MVLRSNPHEILGALPDVIVVPISFCLLYRHLFGEVKPFYLMLSEKSEYSSFYEVDAFEEMGDV